MEGIHVFNLPDDTTEKQLKVYFSNPGNGGGRVEKILYPLRFNSAVVVFENPNTTHSIMEGCHEIKEKRLSIYPLPKQVFGKIRVELEPSCSKFLRRNDHLIDELQYFGELKVEFLSDRKLFVLEGSWYKLEWASQYLNNAMNTFGLTSSDLLQDKEQARDEQRQGYEEMGKADDIVEPIKHGIKKPNIPLIRNPKMKINKNQQIYNRTGMKIPTETATEREGISTYKSEFETKKPDNSTGRYDRETRDDAGNYVFEKTLADSGNSEERYKDYGTTGNIARPFELRSIFFAQDTGFTENNYRPTRMAPRRTKGVDVAETDFGEAPLMYEFNLPNNLKVIVAMDDITNQATDGIINPTSPDLSSRFGASRAILQACGYEMEVELQQYLMSNGALSWAEVFHTNATGALNRSVTQVLHTASPHWTEDDSETATHYLVCTYINCFVYADSKLWLQSIATPVISSGAFGFPLDVCIQAFYDAVLLFATNRTAQHHLGNINLVCFDQDTSMATIMILKSLFECDSKQAIQAAVDRYKTRYFNSNFAAGNFNIDDNLLQARKGQSSEQLQPAKQRRNKNATMKKNEQQEDIETCLLKQEKASGLIKTEKVSASVGIPKAHKDASDNPKEKKTDTILRRKEDEYYIDSDEDNQRSSPFRAARELIIHANEAPQGSNSLKHADEPGGDNRDSINVGIIDEDHHLTSENFTAADKKISGIDDIGKEIDEIPISDKDELEEPESHDVNICEEKNEESENFEDEKTHKELYDDDECVEEKVNDDVESMSSSVAKTLKVSSYDDCEEFEAEPHTLFEEGDQASTINKEHNNGGHSCATEGTESDGKII